MNPHKIDLYVVFTLNTNVVEGLLLHKSSFVPHQNTANTVAAFLGPYLKDSIRLEEMSLLNFRLLALDIIMFEVIKNIISVNFFIIIYIYIQTLNGYYRDEIF